MTGPTGATGSPGAIGATGPSIDAVGEWNSALPGGYSVGDTVFYNRSSWISLVYGNTTTPTSGSNWTLVAEGGATGVTGATGPQGAAGIDATPISAATPIPGGSIGTVVTAVCTTGTVVAGGFEVSGVADGAAPLVVQSWQSSATEWSVTFAEASGDGGYTGTVHAICIVSNDG